MADTTLNRFVSSGTAAERAAFTPTPPTPASGPDPGYYWFETDTGQLYSWDAGASDWVLISGSVTAPPPTGGVSNTFLLSGGQVTWESGFIFRVSAAVYYISGVRYESAESTVTLDAAHATLDRLDVIIVDITGTVSDITGTAAASPSEPSTDPGTQLKLAIVSVPATATEPAGATDVDLYLENAGDPAEWDWTASGGSIVVNSLNNPRTGTTCIEGTTVVAGVYAQGEKGSGTIDPNAYDFLVFFIRSKAQWNNNRGLNITLRNAGVLVGQAVQLRRSGTYGFDSAVTASYQQVAIPIEAFAIPAGTVINQVRLEDFGGSIGFYVDDMVLQAGALTPSTGGITQAQADARYAQRGNNLSDLSSAQTARTNLGLATVGGGMLVLSADPGSPVNGEAWLYDDGATPATIYLKYRKGGVTKEVPLATLN
jgi:hypothetical protein